MNFIEKNTKKVALVLSLATIASAVTTVYAASNADGWHNGVYMEEGKAKTSSWLFLGEEGTYYLNSEGKAITGWKTLNGSTYFFNSEGMRVTGTQVIDGHKYTFQKTSGKLLTGWQEGNTTYFSKYGEAVTGLQVIDGETYLFGEDGTIQKGWKTVEGKKVYFKDNGAMATGVTKVNGKKYNFSANGTYKVGWKKENGHKRYYDKYGFATKGWKTINGKKYLFSKAGNAYTSTEAKGYEFDKNGVAKKIEVEEEATEETTSTSNRNSSNSSSSVSGNMNPSSSINGGSVSSIAYGFVGYPYVWGGSTPSGFDCSGFTMYVYGRSGVSIPRTGYAQSGVGSAVSYNNMQAGDLIIWDGGAHVSLYVGGGTMVHAANPRRGVIVSGVSEWASYGQSITAIRRP